MNMYHLGIHFHHALHGLGRAGARRAAQPRRAARRPRRPPPRPPARAAQPPRPRSRPPGSAESYRFFGAVPKT
jgi:hypothetical protein